MDNQLEKQKMVSLLKKGIEHHFNNDDNFVKCDYGLGNEDENPTLIVKVNNINFSFENKIMDFIKMTFEPNIYRNVFLDFKEVKKNIKNNDSDDGFIAVRV